MSMFLNDYFEWKKDVNWESEESALAVKINELLINAFNLKDSTNFDWKIDTEAYEKKALSLYENEYKSAISVKDILQAKLVAQRALQLIINRSSNSIITDQRTLWETRTQ